MLVDVVELRREGVRLPAEKVKCIEPVRGWLDLDLANAMWVSSKHNPRLMACLFNTERNEHRLTPLDYARVRKIYRGAMLIVGVQQHVRPIRLYEDLPQAWWVRPAT